MKRAVTGHLRCGLASALGPQPTTYTGSFTVMVVETTPPALALQASAALEAAGPSGIPNDLLALNVSQLARKEGTCEGIIEQAMIEQGYALLNPQEFARLVARLEQEILEGSFSCLFAL